MVDKAVAMVLLLLALPVIGVRAATAYARTGRVVVGDLAVGPGGHRFRLLRFADSEPGDSLLHLLAVARGDMRFIGPRPLPAPLESTQQEDDVTPTGAKAGLFSAYRLRACTGIAYEEEAKVDAQHIEKAALLHPDNLGLIARTLVAKALGDHPVRSEPDTFSLFDIPITNTTMAQAVDTIISRAATPAPIGTFVCFVNAACLNTAAENATYRRILQEADLVLPDGVGVKVASRMHHIGLRENVNGTDMFPRLCERAAQERIPVFLLGAREGVAAAAGAAMTARFPGLRLVGTHHGYLAGQEDDVIERVNASGAAILLVAMGVPQQELWLHRTRARLAPAVVMGVGGLFDFYSGRIPRAPLWVRELGMEWMWRLAQEPGRMWRRYVIGNPLFLYRIWRERQSLGVAGVAAVAGPEPLTTAALEQGRAVAAAAARVGVTHATNRQAQAARDAAAAALAKSDAERGDVAPARPGDGEEPQG